MLLHLSASAGLSLSTSLHRCNPRHTPSLRTTQFPLIANTEGTRKSALEDLRTTLDFASFVIVVQWLGYV